MEISADRRTLLKRYGRARDGLAAFIGHPAGQHGGLAEWHRLDSALVAGE
jgi:hypothetical protein